MPELMQNIVAEARKNRYSSIPNLTDEDIIHIWDTVSQYVESQMRFQKGVSIPGFGTFTFSQKKIDVGNSKYILLQRPVFAVSEKFIQTHALQYTKYPITGEIPVVLINFTALSIESGFDRDTVEACVREILQSLNRAVSNRLPIEFLFRGVGILYIKDFKLKMRFFKDFVNVIDGTGRLLKLMENDVLSSTWSPVPPLESSNNERTNKRPDTADSVMSTQTTLTAQGRPGTCTITFPKLNGARDLLPPIHEGETLEDKKVQIPAPSAAVPEDSKNQGDETVVGVGIQSTDKAECPGSSERTGHEENGSRLPLAPQRTSPRLNKPATAGSNRSSPDQSPRKSENVVPEPPAEPKVSITEPMLPRSPGSRSASSGRTSCSPTSHHHRAGQELCYVCMQRSMRNIPVSFIEERKRKEMEQDALLQQYQQMKDHEAMLIEKANQNSMRQSNQKVAAYNLGVAQGVKDAKYARNTDFIKSYVFQNRPLTPLRFYKQEEYNKALETQVKMKRSREDKEKLDREFQERLEHVQLAEDLAAQRERFLREKAEQVTQYQRALSAQIRSKPLPLPKAEADSAEPVFGKHDATNVKLLEQRERSRALLKDQLHAVSEKKKNVVLEQLTKQKEESEMLAKTKKELIADRIGAQRRFWDMRKALERNWRHHHQSKLDREEQERSRLRTPGMLLLQQTDPYSRCGQCQRRTSNCGESNIWSESRYIPGSRLMV